MRLTLPNFAKSLTLKSFGLPIMPITTGLPLIFSSVPRGFDGAASLAADADRRAGGRDAAAAADDRYGLCPGLYLPVLRFRLCDDRAVRLPFYRRYGVYFGAGAVRNAYG